MELHTRECEWAHRIALRNREYYCELEQALADGFDGWAYCLSEYHKWVSCKSLLEVCSIIFFTIHNLGFKLTIAKR
jgi:hypothetical protein